MEFMKKITEMSKIVGRTATDTYNNVADKSEKFFEDTKMKMTLSDKDDEIKSIYETIGKTVYDSYKEGEDIGKVFTKEAKKIDKILAEIEELNKKMLYNKGMRKCENCGEVIKIDNAFCSLCGKNQKNIKIKEEKKETKVNEKDEEIEKVCPQCGLVSEGIAKFCTKCGYKF